MYGLPHIEKLRPERVNYLTKLDTSREIWNEKPNLLISIHCLLFCQGVGGMG